MWRWLGLFVAVYFSFLLFTLPIAALYGWFGKQLPTAVQQNLVIEKLEGTLWQGSIAGRWQDTAIPNLHWQWQPWQLLLAQAAFQVNFDWQRIPIQGNIILSPWQPLAFYQLKGRAPAQAFLQPTGLLGSGEIDFLVEKLTIKPLTITGASQWQDAKLIVLGQTIVLGQLDLIIQPSENNKNEVSVIESKLTSQGGEILINGQLTLQERQLSGSIVLQPVDQANNNLKDLLASFATPAADGSVTLPIRYVLPVILSSFDKVLSDKNLELATAF